MRRFSSKRQPATIERGGLPPTVLGPLGMPVSGPAAPEQLRRERPGPDGIRRGLVDYYRDLIARGELDTPERLEAAESRMFDSLLGGR